MQICQDNQTQTNSQVVRYIGEQDCESPSWEIMVDEAKTNYIEEKPRPSIGDQKMERDIP